MCRPSGVTATSLNVVGVPLERVDERPVDVVQPDVVRSDSLSPTPTTKCTPSGSAATQSSMLRSKVHSKAPSSVHSFAVSSLETLTKRAPPGSTATASAQLVWA